MDVYILTVNGGERTVEPPMIGQQMATESLKRHLALAGRHCGIMVVKSKHPKGLKDSRNYLLASVCSNTNTNLQELEPETWAVNSSRGQSGTLRHKRALLL